MQKQKKKNKMTLNRLAFLTQKSFGELEINFQQHIDGRIDELRGELKGDIRELKGEMDELTEEMRKSSDKMLTAADQMAGQFSLWKDENAIGASQISELRYQTDNHEKRIKTLEKEVVKIIK